MFQFQSCTDHADVIIDCSSVWWETSSFTCETGVLTRVSVTKKRHAEVKQEEITPGELVNSQLSNPSNAGQ